MPYVQVENVNTYNLTTKARRLDRWLDKVVEFSGSELMFLIIILVLLSWALLNETSIQRLQRHVQKLANAAQISFAERALLWDQN